MSREENNFQRLQKNSGLVANKELAQDIRKIAKARKELRRQYPDNPTYVGEQVGAMKDDMIAKYYTHIQGYKDQLLSQRLTAREKYERDHRPDKYVVDRSANKYRTMPKEVLTQEVDSYGTPDKGPRGYKQRAKRDYELAQMVDELDRRGMQEKSQELRNAIHETGGLDNEFLRCDPKNLDIVEGEKLLESFDKNPGCAIWLDDSDGVTAPIGATFDQLIQEAEEDFY